MLPCIAGVVLDDGGDAEEEEEASEDFEDPEDSEADGNGCCRCWRACAV